MDNAKKLLERTLIMIGGIEMSGEKWYSEITCSSCCPECQSTLNHEHNCALGTLKQDILDYLEEPPNAPS